MNNYSMYYSYKGIGDVLIVIFDNAKKATNHVRKGRVEVIYHDDEIIGYNIFDVKEIVKIKSEGKIYLPSPQLIMVVNTILKNAGVPVLEEIKHSGYWTAEVVEINNGIATLSLGEETVYGLIEKDKLNVSDKVVILKAESQMSNGQNVCTSNKNGTIINAYICTNKEVGIKEEGDEILLLDKDEEIGKDFFSTGGK